MNSDLKARRPLRSRGTAWARLTARLLLRLGLGANLISVASLLFAGLAGAAMVLAGRSADGGAWFWLVAAAGIQLRLLCNLMDGMVAVEGGKRTADGDLYNELPDRLADLFILVGAGYASPGDAWTLALGWSAGAASLLTAVVRMQGAALTGEHDFRGPFAKPHRMFVMTVGCLLLGALAFAGRAEDLPPVLKVCLALIAIGTLSTAGRRLRSLSRRLRRGTPT